MMSWLTALERPGLDSAVREEIGRNAGESAQLHVDDTTGEDGSSATAAAIATVAFLALAPDRLPKLATALTAAAGSAILIAAASFGRQSSRR